MPNVQRIPQGTRGLDCNTVISPSAALALSQHGYRFVVRYVRRASTASNDLSPAEIGNLHRAGLAVMPVQHVDPLSESSGWVPTTAKGLAYGQAAATGAAVAAVAHGTTVWLDLEGVKPGTPASDVVAFCNAWFDEVNARGYEPGIYVGWHAGLSASDLYYQLKFERYWAAYNLNADQYPAVRGVCMKQGIALPGDKPAGVNFPIDTDLVTGDKFGGFPAAYAPDEWDVNGVIWGPGPAPDSGGVPDVTGGGGDLPAGGETTGLVILGLLIVAGVAVALRYRSR